MGHEQGKSLIAFAKRLFSVHATGDIAQESAEYRGLQTGQACDGQFGDELFAVGASGSDLQPLSEEAVLTAGQSLIDELLTAVGAEWRGDDHIDDFAPDCLGTRIAENDFRGWVPFQDQPVLVEQAMMRTAEPRSTYSGVASGF